MVRRSSLEDKVSKMTKFERENWYLNDKSTRLKSVYSNTHLGRNAGSWTSQFQDYSTSPNKYAKRCRQRRVKELNIQQSSVKYKDGKTNIHYRVKNLKGEFDSKSPRWKLSNNRKEDGTWFDYGTRTNVSNLPNYNSPEHRAKRRAA